MGHSHDVADGELAVLRAWLQANPPTPRNHAARSLRLQSLQQAADALSAEDYRRYSESWVSAPRRADRFERGGVLKHLRATIAAALGEIAAARVRRGVAMWHLYNMGYVIKTANFCCGIDIQCRDAPKLAAMLDVLLVSHGHADHASLPLIQEMIRLKKPALTLDIPGTIHPGVGQPHRFGSCVVRAFPGDHDARDAARRNDVLLFHVAFPDLGKTILHGSDNSNLARLPRLRPDVFVFHVANNLPVRQAIQLLRPRLALPSHLLELSHSPHAPAPWRHSLARGFEWAGELRPTVAQVLSWGERILLPGASLQAAKGGQRSRRAGGRWPIP